MPIYAIDDKLQELQRFAELGRLSASLIHEISNPLTTALLHLDLGDQSRGIRQARRDMQLIKRYVEAARQQVRKQSLKTSFDVQSHLKQIKRIVMPISRRAGVRLKIEASVNCKLYGDAVKFQHIVTNLIINAIEAYKENDAFDQASLVRVKVFRVQNWLVVQVTDWGKGIAADVLPSIFEAFYTTKNQSGGYGLGIGLAIVKQYVTTDFKGSIDVSSSSRRGTQFTAKLSALPPG